MKLFLFCLTLILMNIEYANSGCVNTANAIPEKGDCIEPSKKNGADIFGWEVPVRDIEKNASLTGTEFFRASELQKKMATLAGHRSYFDKPGGTSYDTSGGGRCNVYFNRSGLFHVGDYDNNLDPATTPFTVVNLTNYWSYFDNFNDLILPKFDSVNSTQRMFSSLDRPTQRQKSTCSSIGMCVCNRAGNPKLRCTSIAMMNQIDDEIPTVYGQNYRATRDLSQGYPEKPEKYDFLQDSCYFMRTCLSSSDNSPKKKCQQHNSTNGTSIDCSEFAEKCMYKDTCINPPNSKGFSWTTINGMQCNHDLECGSSYCQRVPELFKPGLKESTGLYSVPDTFCAPMAKCIPRCLRKGEQVTSNYQFCCKGLVVKKINGVDTCANYGEPFLGVPEFDISIDRANRCIGSINEVLPAGNDEFCLPASWHTDQGSCESKYEVKTVNSTDANGNPLREQKCFINDRQTNTSTDQCKGGVWYDSDRITKFKALFYTRYFEGLSYLWGEADSPGLGHILNVYERAKNIGKRFQDFFSSFDETLYTALDMSEYSMSNALSQEGAASAEAVLKSRALYHLYAAYQDNLKKDAFYDISGVDEILNDLSDTAIQTAYDNFNRLDTRDFDGSDYWRENTIAGFIKGLNNKHGFTNVRNGRYNAVSGSEGCAFGARIGSGRSWCKNASNDHPFCGEGFDGLRDGACIREGWLYNDSGNFHGSEGGGGFLDAIYPLEIRTGVETSSILKPSNLEKFAKVLDNFFEKLFVPTSQAGGMKTRIGANPSNITSDRLRNNIFQGWTKYADKTEVLTGLKCLPPRKNRVSSYLGKSEASLLFKVANPGLTEEDFEAEFKSQMEMNPDYLRHTYKVVVSDLLVDHMIRMHYHKYDYHKRTYRFFRDDRNTGEYNTVMNLLNAAVWLHEYHRRFSELNFMMAECFYQEAESLGESLKSTNKIFNDNERLQNQMVNINKQTNRCDNDTDSSGGGSGGSGEGGDSAGGLGGLGSGMDLNDTFASLSNKDKNGAPIPGDFSDIFALSSKSSLAESQLGELTKSFVNGLSSSKAKSFLGNLKAPSKDKLAKLKNITKRLKLSKNDKVDNNSFVKKLLNNFSGKPQFLQTLASNSLPTSNSSVRTNLNEIKKQATKDKIQTKESKYRSRDDDDDDYFDEAVSTGGSYGNRSEEVENERLNRMLKKVQDRPNPYVKNDKDTLFQIISKTYMTTGLRKLIGKRVRKRVNKKKLPSLKSKYSKPKDRSRL